MTVLARRRHGRSAAGQSLTEVIVIVFLVGIGAIGVVGLFGDNIRGLFGGSAAAVAGNTSVGNTGQEAQQTQWTLRGGSLSAYNPAATPDSVHYGGGGSSDAVGGGISGGSGGSSDAVSPF